MVAMEEANGAKRQKLTHEVDLKVVQVSVHGKQEEFPVGTTVKDALGDDAAVAARLDNVVVPLLQPIIGSSSSLEPVSLASSDGIRVLVETLKFLLKIAKHECTPELAITVGKPIGAAYYCMLTDKVSGKIHKPTEEQLIKLQEAMVSLIEGAIPMPYKTVATKMAIENMGKTGAGFSAKVLADCNVPQVTVVECRGLYHVPRAPIMASSDMVPKDSFKLTAFKEGFCLNHFRVDASGALKHSAYSPEISDLLYNEYMERQQWARDVELFSVQQLNRAIRDGNSKKVIQAVEANCDRQFVELANKIKNKAGVKLILIAGPSSSGKTTFAKRLQVQLESLGYKPEVVSVDSFYKGWPDINSEGPHKVDWEALDSLNLKQLNDVLLTLMDGKEALVPEYDMKTSMPADKSHWTKMQLSTRGKGVIIMEGIHCLNPALTAAVPKEQKFQIAIAPIPALQLDATHLLSGTTIRMLRRMVRDYLNRGRPVLATLKQWPGVVKGERDNIYPHQGNADAVMNSEIGYEMCVLKVHVEPLLKTVCPTEREYSEVRRLLETLEQFIALPTTVIPPQSLLREFVGGSWYYDFGGWYKSY